MAIDWAKVQKAVEEVLGRDSFYTDPDVNKNSGIIVSGKKLLAVVAQGHDDVLYLSFRASVLPNVSASLTAQLSYTFKVELDPYFELDNNGEMILGQAAVRFFAENARLLLLGEKEPLPTSIAVRPKGQYTKHRFN